GAGSARWCRQTAQARGLGDRSERETLTAEEEKHRRAGFKNQSNQTASQDPTEPLESSGIWKSLVFDLGRNKVGVFCL
ncbi:hypothetical protein chiPu_0024787, partial [Chiloscyllium punctatum]|nr:hypothetical protein [Chiloscyllium punctatum]